jgi:probable HAF family extracellular repeat protein
MAYAFTTIDDPLGTTVGVNGINNAGQIVGSYSVPNEQHGFLLSAGTFTTIDDPDANVPSTAATGINASGQIAGTFGITFTSGFLKTANSYTTISIQGRNVVQADGINDAGQVVGYDYFIISGPPFTSKVAGFVYSNGTLTTISHPDAVGGEAAPGGNPASGTYAEDINNAGDVVGTYIAAGSAVHGFLFHNGAFTTLDHPLGVNRTHALGINNVGQIVGWFGDLNGGHHGFILSGGVYTTLDDPLGAGGTIASDINDSGLIVGSYVDSGNVTHGFLATPPNPPPPADTTGDMIMRHGPDGFYEIYNIGHGALLAGYLLGQVGTDYQFAGLGNFSGTGTSDMMLRSATTGAFQVYDIVNNNITGTASLGAVGLEWQVVGRGDFNHDGATDMMLRNASTGGFEVYNINNNKIVSAAFMGLVGLDWQVAGFGDFNHDGTSDMLLRNAARASFSSTTSSTTN